MQSCVAIVLILLPWILNYSGTTSNNLPMASLTRSSLTFLVLSLLTFASAQSISHGNKDGRPVCTVHAGKQNTTDDVPNILKAFEHCGNGGNIVFPAGQTYHINSKLNPVVNDVTIDWQGEWLVRYGIVLFTQ